MQKQIVRQSTGTTGRVLLVAHVQNSEHLYEQATRLQHGGAQIVEQGYTTNGHWSRMWVILRPAREAMQTQLF